MSFHIPDPCLEMPDLIIPKRIPAGPVQIDHSHQLARGIKGCFVATQRNVNLANYHMLAPCSISGYTNNPTYNGGTASFAGNSILIDDIGVPPDYLWSVFTVSKNTNNSNGIVGGFGNDISGFEREAFIISPTAPGGVQGTWRYEQGGAGNKGDGNAQGTFGQGSGRYFSSAGVTNRNAMKLYHAGIGEPLGTATATLTDITGNTAFLTDMNLFCVGGAIDSNSIAAGFSAFNGDIDCVYVWHRALSDAEVWSLCLDPHQFLVPV
ncbi:MAG: LamG domain-containing protein [Gammaproteobacteria bacterium]|nr:LamG domain-containing protein [Gammaproteobacteria bacterium]